MYEVDALAGIVAMANKHEQLALTEDIRKNGQTQPAVLWHNRIVDGRCRQLACLTLDIELSVRKLDDNLTREEVADIVKSLNIRRNLTDTQKAMSAFKEQEKAWETNETTARQWGIPLGTYKNARYVAVNRPEVVDPLFNGESVKIYDPKKGRDIVTNKINTLARIIKCTKEAETVFVDDSEKVVFTLDSSLKTEAAKDWYYDAYERAKQSEVTLGMLLVELANLKFKEK